MVYRRHTSKIYAQLKMAYFQEPVHFESPFAPGCLYMNIHIKHVKMSAHWKGINKGEYNSGL